MSSLIKKPFQTLCWSDSVLASTGFGIVSKNILNALYKTGFYEIDQLAINYFGDFYDKEQVPYCIVPAKLGNPNDPYGNQMLLQSLNKKDYDYLFIINDTFVVEGVADGVEEIRQKKIREGKKPFSIIYYFPVDCRILPTASKMIKIADRAVAYTQFAADEAEKAGLKSTDIIHHGVDTELFYPLSSKEKRIYRKQYLGVDDDTFVLINVNRNSLRKDIPRTILAFSEFRKKVPKSLLYLHTKVEDGFGGHNIDLKVPLEELGLSMRKDVIFPNSYNPAKGFPPQILNQLYNCGDCYISSHCGEGFGLCLGSETILDTLRGGIPIKNILIGDEVIGGDGKFHKVLNKTSRVVEQIYSVKAMYSTPILVTAEHPFFVMPKDGNIPSWTNVKDINLGDYLCIPKSTENEPLPNTIDITEYLNDKIETDGEFIWYKMGYSPKKNGLSIQDIQKQYNVSKRVAEDARRCFLSTSLPSRGLSGSLAYSIAEDIKQKKLSVNTQVLKIKRHIAITDEFLYFIGWYLAEGSNGSRSKIELDFHIKESTFAKKIGEYLSLTFGVEAIFEKNGINKCRVRISGQALSKVLGTICGEKAWNKKVPSFLLKSPQKLGPLLLSLFLGDGHYEREHRTLSLTTTSPSLAYQTRYICAANNMLTTTQEYPPRGLGKHRQFQCGIVSPHLERWKIFTKQEDLDIKKINRKSAVHFIEDDKCFYIKVKKISKKLSSNKQVYDIQVENSHSFLANGILAHNTVVESMACGTPVIVPDNTVTPELVSGRGYVYPCKEKTYIDNCYTPDTEVLTEEGWKLFQDLTYENKLCTLNTETEEIEYQLPSQIIHNQYNGLLYSLKHHGSLNTDLLVTENHNLLASRYNKKKKPQWEFFKPKDIFGKRNFLFKKTGQWISKEHPMHFILPSSKNNLSRQIPIKLWMEFMGYYLSEGSVTFAKESHYIVQLRQNAGPVLDRMVSLFKEMGFNPHIGSDNSRVIVYDKDLFTYLKLLGKKHEKYIPRILLTYSKELLVILFEALMAGDGHNLYYRDFIERETVEKKGGSSYATSSLQLRDDFMELLLKIGYSGTYRLQAPKGTPWHIEGRSGVSQHDLWVVGISYKNGHISKQGSYHKVNNKWTYSNGWKEEWIKYNGPVFCATVPNHTLYVRRNGCPIWSGNSGFRKIGHLDDIVDTMYKAYEDWKNPENGNRSKIISAASKFATEHSWKEICKSWVALFATTKYSLNTNTFRGEKI